MQAGNEHKQQVEIEKDTTKNSVCSSSIEQERLLKLFQLFIEIDKNLKLKGNEDK